MGRRKKTENERWLGGTLRADRPPAPNESVLAGGRPKIPKHVKNRALFRSLCQQLAQRRHLTSGDAEIIGLYCVLHERFTRAQAALASEGEIVTYTRQSAKGDPFDVVSPNLWLKVSETASRQMLSCLASLGLTPQSRDKIKATQNDVAAPERNYIVPGSLRARFPEFYGLNGRALPAEKLPPFTERTENGLVLTGPPEYLRYVAAIGGIETADITSDSTLEELWCSTLMLLEGRDLAALTDTEKQEIGSEIGSTFNLKRP